MEKIVLKNDSLPTNVIFLNTLPLGEIDDKDEQTVEFLIKGEFPHQVYTQVIDDSVLDLIANQLTNEWKRDIQIDYQHESLIPGARSLAAGWLKWETVTRTANGLQAVFEWTKKAAQHIREKEYRYFSPVLDGDLPTKKITGLHNIGLTNNPNMHSLQALTNEYQRKENVMDLKKILKMLGLAEDTTDVTLLENAITTLQTQATEGTASVALVNELVTVAGVANATELKTAMVSKVTMLNSITDALGHTDPAKAALAAGKLKAGDETLQTMVNELQSKVVALQNAKRVETLDAAVIAGKITPDMKPTYVTLMNENPAMFDQLVGKLEVVIPSGPGAPGHEPKGGSVLTANELEVCKKMQITPEAFAETKKIEAAKRAELMNVTG